MIFRFRSPPLSEMILQLFIGFFSPTMPKAILPDPRIPDPGIPPTPCRPRWWAPRSPSSPRPSGASKSERQLPDAGRSPWKNHGKNHGKMVFFTMENCVFFTMENGNFTMKNDDFTVKHGVLPWKFVILLWNHGDSAMKSSWWVYCENAGNMVKC